MMSRRERRRKNRKIRNDIFFAVLAIVSVFTLVYAGYHLIGYYSEYRKESAQKEELLQLREEILQADGQADVTDKVGEEGNAEPVHEQEQIRDFYQKMKKLNEDYVCWLTVKGTGIDYPVLQRDNSYYLNHNIENELNRHGSVFLDENCELKDDVLLLHGHHMKDGTMFGELKKFKENAFCEENREIVLELATGRVEYQIFAVAQVDLTAEGSFVFEVLPATEEEKVLYIEGLDRASFWFDETVIADGVEKEAFVLLSTCDYGTDDERLLVAAKKIE